MMDPPEGQHGGNKRSFSALSEDTEPLGEHENAIKSSGAPAEEPVEVEGAAQVERERVGVVCDATGPAQCRLDGEWWSRFLQEDRADAMPPVVLSCGGRGSHRLPQTALDMLVGWYGKADQWTVPYAIVNHNDGFKKLSANPKSTVSSIVHDVTGTPATGSVATESSGSVLETPQESFELWAAVPPQFSRKLTAQEFGRISGLRPVESYTTVDALHLEDNEIVIVEPPNSFPAGKVGLLNLGNTCFMNSSLQCLIHIPELVAYFVAGHHSQDLNRDNPIGCGGAVADAFTQLMEHVWGDRTTVYNPSMFRTTIGRFNRAFASYMQQDSQEFTVFLLDSLHEDLNRVRSKPGTTKPELPEGASASNPEAVANLAHQCWETHCLRNDSVIQDTFTGVYKSTVICPECGFVSVTFDPFFDLTLPLPGSVGGKWAHEVLYVPLAGPSYQTEVALAANATVADLKLQVEGLVSGLIVGGSLPSNHEMTVADIYASRFFRFLGDSDVLAAAVNSDDVIVVYEIEPGTSVPVYCRHDRLTLFGVPFFVADSTDIEELKNNVQKRFEELHVVDDSSVRTGLQLAIHDGPPEQFNRWGIGQVRSIEPENVDDSKEPDNHKDSIQSKETAEFDEPTGPGSLPQSTESVKTSEEQKDPTTSSMGSETGLTSPQPSVSSISTGSDTGPAPISQANSSVPDLDGGSEPPSLSSDALEAMDTDKALGTGESGDNEPRESSSEPPRTSPLVGMATLVIEFEQEFDVRPPETLENPVAAEARAEATAAKNTTLDESLKRFAQPEVLGEHDEWYCSKCREFRRARKQMELWRIPDVFMIHLKRFSDFQSIRDKITDLVEFPVSEWNVAPHMSPDSPSAHSPLLYDLVAVDNHFGSLGGGHYTAFAQNIVGDENWYYYDDTSVHSVLDPEDAETPAAYLLFYRRRRSPGEDAAVTAAQAAVATLRRQNLTKARAPPLPPQAPAPPPLPHRPAVTPASDSWGPGNVLGTSSSSASGSAPVLPWASPPEGSDIEGLNDLQLEPLTGDLPSYDESQAGAEADAEKTFSEDTEQMMVNENEASESQ